jgi:hypothetical protein
MCNALRMNMPPPTFVLCPSPNYAAFAASCLALPSWLVRGGCFKAAAIFTFLC